MRKIILKTRSFKPDALYIATQTQDRSGEIFKALHELQYKPRIYTNEVAAYAVRHFQKLEDQAP